MVVLTAGCGASSDPVRPPQTTSPSQPQSDSPSALHPITEAPNPDSVETAQLTALQQFIQRDEFCRDVLSSQSLADFLVETLSATRDTRISRPDLGYVVYRDTMFTYEFLDEQLFAIRYILPRTRDSAEKSMVPYQQAFGLPTNTIMPQDLKDAQASTFLSWDLPEHNLRVKFAYLPPSFVESDVNLFGQFVNVKIADELGARLSKAPPASEPMEKN
ncbi:MAG: hypothetical protein JWN70_1636 [Planctomycetaceae bacterium]|nr:hypothetical protein [Planctomycetaceae bacterium]